MLLVRAESNRFSGLSIDLSVGLSVGEVSVLGMETQVADVQNVEVRPQSRVKSIGQSLFLVLSATVISIWGFNWIPFEKLPFTHFWTVITIRSFEVAFWVAVMWALKPRMLKRLFVIRDPMRLLGGFGVVAILTIPQLFRATYHGHSFPQVIEGLVFALFIGIDEEIFSRGLIYGFLDKYGVKVAAIVSSVHFGMLHLGNAVWGGQSFAYTFGQVLDAAAFGYLCCGLMLYSRSILVPIVLHGLVDFPMQMVTAAQYTTQVTGGFDWLSTLFDLIIYTVIGWRLICASR